MHKSTFDYLKPTDAQMVMMDAARIEFRNCAAKIDLYIPDGPDKDHVMRKLREAAMWTNVAITRHPDGSPRGS